MLRKHRALFIQCSCHTDVPSNPNFDLPMSRIVYIHFYENNFQYWMCGGEVYYVPCSRVLHYAAERSPMNHGDRKKAKHYLHNAGLIIKVATKQSHSVYIHYHVHVVSYTD